MHGILELTQNQFAKCTNKTAAINMAASMHIENPS